MSSHRTSEDPAALNSRSSGSGWFALQIRSKHEKLVATHLSGRDFEWFLPLYKRRKLWSDRIKEVEAPLFPGYIFCRFNPENRLPILTIPGVIQIVGYNRLPVPIEETEIGAIQALVASGVPNQPWPFMAAGDNVRIVRGPLTGMEGILIAFKGSHRLILSVTLLQRSVAVEVDSALVLPVDPAPARGPKVGYLHSHPIRAEI
jgi:transcription antitermination factor NusG